MACGRPGSVQKIATLPEFLEMLLVGLPRSRSHIHSHSSRRRECVDAEVVVGDLLGPRNLPPCLGLPPCRPLGRPNPGRLGPGRPCPGRLARPPPCLPPSFPLRPVAALFSGFSKLPFRTPLFFSNLRNMLNSSLFRSAPRLEANSSFFFFAAGL